MSAKLRFYIKEDSTLYSSAPESRPLLDSPDAVFDFYKGKIRETPGFECHKENLLVFCLDTRLRLIGWNIVAVGTKNECPFSPAEILKYGILSDASYLIVAHNHPSGDVSPSRADTSAGERLKAACEIVGVPIRDFLIFGNERYFSFVESMGF